MTTETRAIIAKARADIAAHAAGTDRYRPIATTLLDSVEALVTAVANQAVVDQTRVEELEMQVRTLATAVLSITEAVCQSAPAIIALQDEMDKHKEINDELKAENSVASAPRPSQLLN